MVAEERFLMLEQWYTTGKLLDDTKWQIIIIIIMIIIIIIINDFI